MRLFSFYWGILGVIGILGFAIVRLMPKVIEMSAYHLDGLQLIALLTFVPYMAYAEGYKGFYLNFSPRIIARANYLLESPSVIRSLFAPLFCMGFFHATFKRKLVSFIVTTAIVLVVILVGYAPQPLRGIIDSGVVVGLGIGIISILKFWAQAQFGSWQHPISADLPE